LGQASPRDVQHGACKNVEAIGFNASRAKLPLYVPAHLVLDVILRPPVDDGEAAQLVVDERSEVRAW